MLKTFVIPPVIFYIISWVGMWLDPGAVPERVGMAVIPVLAQGNLMSAFSASIPPISYATRLDSFLILTLIMVAVHTAEFGVVDFSIRRWKVLGARQEELREANVAHSLHD